MKILHISTPMGWRGGEQQAWYLVDALADMGIRNAMLCPAGSEMEARLKPADCITFTFKSRGLLNLNLAYEVSKICKSQGIDLVHTHDAHAHAAAVLAATFFRLKAPLVISRRVDFAVSPTPFSRWKYNHHAVKRILCVSEEIRKITAPSIRRKEYIRVVHSGIDLKRYASAPANGILHKELDLPSEVLLVGNLSALADHKDYTTWIRAAAEIIKIRKDIHFIIAGGGAEESRIKSLIGELGISNRVHMLGFRKDVVSVMQSLDVFMISSATEGLGTIVLEAFAAGVPVVATAAGGIPELVENGVTGLLVPVRDYKGLCKDVLRIFADTALRDQLVKAARVKVEEFSYLTTAQKTLDQYKEVLSK